MEEVGVSEYSMQGSIGTVIPMATPVLKKRGAAERPFPAHYFFLSIRSFSHLVDETLLPFELLEQRQGPLPDMQIKL